MSMEKDRILEIVKLFARLNQYPQPYIDNILQEQSLHKIMEMVENSPLQGEGLFLLIALSHPHFTPNELNHIANTFSLDMADKMKVAALSGNIKYFQFLLKDLPSTDHRSFINEDLPFYLRYGIVSGNVQFLEYLKSLDPNNFADMNQDDKVAAMGSYVYNPAAEVFDFLYVNFLGKMTEEEKISVVCYLYPAWVGYGCIDSLKKLESITPNLENHILKSKDYIPAFQSAAENNHIESLEYLIEKFPDKMDEMINPPHYSPFTSAAHKGNVGVLKYLLKQFPDKVQKIISSTSFLSFKDGAPLAKQFLLNFPEIFSFALKDRNSSYDDAILTFAKNFITKLQERNKNDYPHVVYSKEEAEIGFYCLKYFIKNSRGPLDPSIENFVSFLIGIPAIVDILHAPISSKQSVHKEHNELLRWAMRYGKQDWVLHLMTYEKVASRAEMDDFYEDEDRGIALREIVNNTESATAGLNHAEQELVQVLEEYYPLKNFTKEWELMINEMVEYYLNNPAVLTLNKNGESKQINLPGSWQEFQQLCKNHNLTNDEQQLANKVYFKNPVHTTLRFLMKPNPWMDPYASFVMVDSSGSYVTFIDNNDKLLVQLWKAISDSNAPASEGYTLFSRIEEFFNSIALVARAHNWDMTRGVVRNGKAVREYYDDGEGDKPSCPMGMKKRFLDSVKGHPLLEGNFDAYVNEYIREKVYNSFSEKLSALSTEELEAIDIYIKTNKYNNLDKITKKFKISQQELNDWAHDLLNPSKTKDIFEEKIKPFLKSSNHFLDGLLKYNFIQIVQNIIANRPDLTYKKELWQDSLDDTHQVSKTKLWDHVLYLAPAEDLKTLDLDKLVNYLQTLDNNEDEQADLLDYLFINQRDLFNTLKDYDASKELQDNIIQIESSNTPKSQTPYSKFLEIYNSSFSHLRKFINIDVLSDSQSKEEIRRSLKEDLEKINYTLEIDHHPLIENLIRKGFIDPEVAIHYRLLSSDAAYESLPSNPLCDTKEEFEIRANQHLSRRGTTREGLFARSPQGDSDDEQNQLSTPRNQQSP